MREVAPWRLTGVDHARAIAFYAQLNAAHNWIFIYHFANGDVSIEPKSESVQPTAVQIERAQKYLSHFHTVVKRLDSSFRATLCIGVDDALPEDYPFPVFCFQKKRGSRNVLLPDIDFHREDYYEHAAFTDFYTYHDKQPSAVFTGGTTGGDISVATARDLALPRLRAAGFFWGNPRVDFRLPHIGQCTSQEAYDLLEARPFCQRPRLSWGEQLEKRFVISMDGNGATCSRVVIVLKSNSVLLKYESDHILYYFEGMQPWLHYVPIAEDADVEKVLDLEIYDSTIFEQIAAKGREFAQTYLSRNSVHHYTALVLQLYANSFTDAKLVALPRGGLDDLADDARGKSVALLAHIQERGDCPSDNSGWVGKPGSKLAIEGFSILLDLTKIPGLPTYQAVMADGTLSEPCYAGEFCGTRGEAKPVFGLLISVDEAFAALYSLTYEASFVDGSRLGPVPAETICSSRFKSPLEAFRVTLLDVDPPGPK